MPDEKTIHAFQLLLAVELVGGFHTPDTAHRVNYALSLLGFTASEKVAFWKSWVVVKS